MSAEPPLRLVAGERPRRKTALMTPRLALRGAAMARSEPAPSLSLTGESSHGKL
jgi:hypothetical protein